MLADVAQISHRGHLHGSLPIEPGRAAYGTIGHPWLVVIAAAPSVGLIDKAPWMAVIAGAPLVGLIARAPVMGLVVALPRSETATR